MKRAQNVFPEIVSLVLLSCSLPATRARSQINIATVPVVHAGNAGDQDYGEGSFGAVGYAYEIGRYEVTLGEYCGFLNAVAQTDTYGVYNPQMAVDLNIAGISRTGVSGSYSYSVMGSANRPVTYVSWFDGARFVNWLHNGQPTGMQSAATTEEGSYTLSGAMTGTSVVRNADASFVLPNENEWYKAAYHQPASAGGDSDDYWAYPTANNSVPNSRNGSESDPNSVNVYRDDNLPNGFNGGYAVTDSTEYSPTQNYLTEVGAFSLARSYHGTFDQGGNVWEWVETAVRGSRGIRGGFWGDSAPNMLASDRSDADSAAEEDSAVGFRIAVVPEPGAAGIIVLGAGGLAWRWKRRS